MEFIHCSRTCPALSLWASRFVQKRHAETTRLPLRQRGNFQPCGASKKVRGKNPQPSLLDLNQLRSHSYTSFATTPTPSVRVHSLAIIEIPYRYSGWHRIRISRTLSVSSTMETRLSVSKQSRLWCHIRLHILRFSRPTTCYRSDILSFSSETTLYVTPLILCTNLLPHDYHRALDQNDHMQQGANT